MFNLKSKEECFVNFNFFFLKEYEIEASNGMAQEQLIETFINSRVFIETFYPFVSMDKIKEFPIQDIKAVAAYTMHGPFGIECIGINDFKRYKGRQLRDALFDYSEKAGSSADDGAINNFKQSLQLVEKFEIEEDDLFHLNKEWFSSPNKALLDFASIYDYYLLFIAVNPNRNRLLLLDYGAD